jgi:glycosyltransferase involved in cell wall biosynthesis
MKILYVITGADIGGAQNHLLYLSEWFHKQGHDVHVVLGEEGPLQEALAHNQINTTVIPIPRTIHLRKDLQALMTLFLFMKKGNYDIVHSHSSKAGILARFAGFLNRMNKNIYTAHGFVFTDPTLSKKKSMFYLSLEKAFSLISTDIITVSAFDYQHGSDKGINEEKMTVIHNGIPNNSILSIADWKSKQRHLRELDKRIIGFVGRFSPEKNLDMLLRVAEHFKKESHEKLEFWLLGDGPLFTHYQTEIKNRSLESLIHLKGSQDNVAEWMDQMHCMIITSHKEGLPYVLLEACGRGLPVVSTDVGGVKEVVDPLGTENLLVSINDDLDMYHRLVAIISNDKEREQLGLYFLSLAESFTVEQMGIKTNEIYSKKRKR